MSELRLHGTPTRKLAPLVPRRHDGLVASPGAVEPERREHRLDALLDRLAALLGPSGEGAAPALPERLSAKDRARGGAFQREIESDRIEVAGAPTGTTFRVSVRGTLPRRAARPPLASAPVDENGWEI
ncbi:hypothetical protein WME99_43380 [Sorangium sp. So ce136]|uniref:hypothetical protein n=1 Tax=Sorangium sp. So ce136 TaxID=3133284 RepID=UPI003EFE7EAE